MKNSAFVLWLEGVDPLIFSQVPALTELARRGIDLRLTPLPLVEKGVCYYQTLTGMGSGKFGRFDAVHPEGYRAYEEATIPDGVFGRTLPDVLRSHNLAVTFLEVESMQALDKLVEEAYDCAIVRLLDMGKAKHAEIDAIVRRCIDLATPFAHMIVLTDTWSQASKLVNVNDFLADVGLLEVSIPRNRAEIIWPETLAYGLGTGQVWINLRGRETQGIVSSGSEYQEVCTALVQELRTKWLDPSTNESVVEQVLRRDEAFMGEYLFKAPDLAVIFRPGYALSPRARDLDFDGIAVQEIRAAGGATAPYARLVASGPNLVSGLEETGALVDVMPTLMYMLDQPVPSNVDGSVISSIFTQAYLREFPLRYAADNDELLSDEEEGLIVDRLRDLGYMG